MVAEAGGPYPSVSNFLRHTNLRSVVLGDYLYIDGGEISQLVDGVDMYSETGGTWPPSYPVNSTYFLPLSSPWTSATVSISSAAKRAPRYGRHHLFPSPGDTFFLQFNGEVSAGDGAAPPQQLWALEATHSAAATGNGSWVKLVPGNAGTLASLSRTVGGSSAVMPGNEIGWAFGGYRGPSTFSLWKENRAVPGIVQFSMKGLVTRNITSAGFGNHGTLVNGDMQFAPFGQMGTLVFLGGWESPTGELRRDGWFDWESLWVFDLKNFEFHAQATTGERPPPLERFCSVGVRSPHDTFEIFIYGGVLEDSSPSTDVYVLSLPGFYFYKDGGTSSASANATRRADHSCSLVNARQMVSVGGIDPSLAYPAALLSPDPWPFGISLLDLSELKWSDSFDPEAGRYEAPGAIRTWYEEGGFPTVKWDSDAVRELFANGPAPFATSPVPSDTPGDDTGTEENRSVPGVGAIVGGVLGGLAAAFFIAILVASVLRRRKRRVRESPPSHAYPGSGAGHPAVPELQGGEDADVRAKSSAGSLPGPPAARPRINVAIPAGGRWSRNLASPIEMQPQHGRSELHSPVQRHEMPGSTSWVERKRNKEKA